MKHAFLIAAVLLGLAIGRAVYAQQDLSGGWAAKAGPALTITQQGEKIEIRLPNGLTLRGSLSGSRIEASGVIEKLAMAPAGLPEGLRQRFVGETLRIEGEVGAGGERLRLTLIAPQFDADGSRRPEPQRQEFEFSRLLLKFLDAWGEEATVATSFSHPYPVVELKEVTTADLSVSSGTVQVQISGTVTDAIADIVAENRADPKEVELTYFVPDQERGKRLVRKTLPLRRMEESGSALRPYAFRAAFSASAEIPIETSDVLVAVTVKNLIGHSGSDSFSIQLRDRSPESIGSAEAAGPARTSEDILGVLNHESTSEGLVNPVRIQLVDPTLDGDALVRQKIRIGEASIGVRLDGEDAFADRPIMALAGRPPEGIPNLVQATVVKEPTTVTYRGVRKSLDWAYTAQPQQAEGPPIARMDAPPIGQKSLGGGTNDEGELFSAAPQNVNEPQLNYYTYAGGTLVDMRVYSRVFDRLSLSGPGQVEPLILRRAGSVHGRPNYRQENIELRVIEAKRLDASSSRPGYRIRIQLRGKKEYWGGYRLRLRLHEVGGGGPAGGYTVTTAEFRVVPLRTVIFAIDGLGRQSFDSFLSGRSSDDGSTGLREIFLDAPSRNIMAYSALPSITFTNWPGVFSGMSPAQHGIQGNSFHMRDRREAFASTGGPIASIFRGAGVALDLPQWLVSSLNELARNEAGSLYERVATAIDEKIQAASIHAFYARPGRKGNVDLARERYFPNPFFMGHNASAARRLDEASGEVALEHYNRHGDSLEILTVYLPGPDNVAHSIGQKVTPDVGPGKYSSGPALPEVNTPLYSIAEHVRLVTDKQVKALVQAIQKRGFLPATLFVLVADHGLHAYRNEAGFNIDPDQFDRFLTAMGLKLWNGGAYDAARFGSLHAVISANGGMAHFYLRGEQGWQSPPEPNLVRRVAAQLFVEATGGQVVDPRGQRVTYGDCSRNHSAIQNAICHSGLLRFLAPSAGTAPAHRGAFGTPPAVFLRACEQLLGGREPQPASHWQAEFQWLKFAYPGSGRQVRLECAPIEEFLRARAQAENGGYTGRGSPPFTWPAFKERLEELNDRNPQGSRTGDILVFVDGRAGFLFVNSHDEMNGWHGGATVSESEVPLLLNMPTILGGPVEPNLRDSLIRSAAWEAARGRAATGATPTLRNWQLTEILERIYRALRDKQ